MKDVASPFVTPENNELVERLIDLVHDYAEVSSSGMINAFALVTGCLMSVAAEEIGMSATQRMTARAMAVGATAAKDVLQDRGHDSAPRH